MTAVRRLTPPPSLVHVIATGLLHRLITNDGPPVTRTTYAAELASTLPVSAPTATRAARELIDSKLVIDGPEVMRGNQGRPEKSLDLSPDFVALGVSIFDAPDYEPTTERPGSPWPSKASRVHAVAIGLNGRMIASAEEVTVDSSDPVELVSAIATVLDRVKDDRDLPEIVGIGLLTGGHVRSNVLRYSHNIGRGPAALDLPGLIGEEVARRGLSRFRGVPILLDNDVDALARHRAWFGRPDLATADSDFAVILLKDDGLGGALVRDGCVASASPFEVGHLESDISDKAPACRCGNVGCVEAVATPFALAKKLGVEGPSVAAMVAEFYDRLEKGDEAARSALDGAATALGRAIATVVNLTAPPVVYVYAPERLKADEMYVELVRETAKARAMPHLREDLVISFEPLPDDDETTAAAAAKVVEATVKSFELGQN